MCFEFLSRIVNHDEQRPAGRYGVNWDGRDDAGHELSSGVYLTRVETGGGVMAGRMTLMR